MTYDTTDSNTGHVSAACSTLQQSTSHALLWSACCHHVAEVTLTQLFNDLKLEALDQQNIHYLVDSRRTLTTGTMH